MFKWLKNAGKRWDKANRDFERRATKSRCNDGFHSCWGRCIPKDRKCGRGAAAAVVGRTLVKGAVINTAMKPLGNTGTAIGGEIASRSGQYETKRRRKKHPERYRDNQR